MDLSRRTRSTRLMNPPVITLTLGGLVILLAVVTPSSGILHVLSTRPGDRLPELLLGIRLFKYSLAAFGCFLMVLNTLPICKRSVPAYKKSSESRYHSL